MDREITPLELSVASMFSVFVSNKGQDGKLSKEQFLKVLKEELPNFGEAADGEEIFNSVDVNQDGSVEFKEFAFMVATFASASYEILQEIMKNTPK